MIVPCDYDFVRDFIGGIAAVKKNGKWGYINKKGRVMISCKYDRVTPFKDGLAMVSKDGVWSIINELGGVIVAECHESTEWSEDIIGSNIK
jgi:hypothetical protein